MTNERGKATFSLGREYLALLDKMSDRTHLSKSQLIRIMMDTFAPNVGLERINNIVLLDIEIDIQEEKIA